MAPTASEHNHRESWGGPSWNHADHRAIGRRRHRHLDLGVRSLRCHATYLEHLGGAMAEPDSFLRSGAEEAGRRAGVDLATTFEIIA